MSARGVRFFMGLPSLDIFTVKNLGTLARKNLER